jgi:uncharacterized protein YbcI
MPDGNGVSEQASGAVGADLAREVVRIHARYFGRGPTKAKAIWRNGVVAVILEEIFTRAEELLVEAGQFEQVRQHRQAFQDQIAPILRQSVEQITGHRVEAFLSQVSAEGVAAEVFTLGEPLGAGSEPAGGEGA